METGDIIKFLRKKYNLTQDELAIKLRVNKSSIQKYESGAVQNLKIETIRELCEIFGVPPVLFIFPEKIEHQDIINKLIYTELTEDTISIAELNSLGRKKVMEYIRDLVDSGNY